MDSTIKKKKLNINYCGSGIVRRYTMYNNYNVAYRNTASVYIIYLSRILCMIYLSIKSDINNNYCPENIPSSGNITILCHIKILFYLIIIVLRFESSTDAF